MSHVFVSPHADDIALSCGGLVASLRDLGQSVTIITVFSGAGSTQVTDYQRTALGFGTKALWPLTEAFRRDNIAADYPLSVGASGRPDWQADPDKLAATQERANVQARQFWQRAAWTRSANITNAQSEARPLADSVGGQGSTDPTEFDAPGMMGVRKAEEERYAYFAEASVVFLDLPDAVFRGYEGDTELLGAVRDDDEPPFDILRREILRLEPQQVYFPLAVGNHVDHQLCREVGLALLGEGRRWVMPADAWVGRVSFYEDFPYAWWRDFGISADGPARELDLPLPAGVGLEARYANISESLDRKAAGISLYASQISRLFESEQGMLDDLAGYHARVAAAGGMSGYAERYWGTVKP